jgi:hypothetical protein
MADVKTWERLRVAALACEGWSWPDRMRDKHGRHHFGQRREGEFYEIGTIDASTYTSEYADDIRALKFIRAAQPETVLALFAEIADLRAALQAQQGDSRDKDGNHADDLRHMLDELEAKYEQQNTAFWACSTELQQLKEAQQGDAVLMDWLEAQNHVHALQWRGTTFGIKTALYDRDRQMIAEGATLREAVAAAMLAARREG